MLGSPPPGRDAVLTIEGLRLQFHTFAGDVKALDGVDLTIYRGEVFGLVGESGCGKSVTALSIARLLPENAEIIDGRIFLKGEDLLKKTREEMREVRMRRIAMIFQDPMTFLNPVLTIGEQLTEVYLLDPERLKQEAMRENQADKTKAGKGNRLSKGELKRVSWNKSVEVLKLVRLPDAERIMKRYPHELSGGMRQRTIIAMALARNPDLLIADEITTALDVTVQAQILALLKELRRQIDASIVIITHDLGIVAEMCDRVGVMYAGNVVEVAEVKELFRNPLHPYTQGLLNAIPKIHMTSDLLDTIPGSVPDLIYPPSGCRFHPRCPYSFDPCPKYKPPLIEATPGHYVACFLHGGIPSG